MNFLIWQSESDKQWRWTLFAANNQIVATCGEGYRDRSHAVQMVEWIKRNAPLAPVR